MRLPNASKFKKSGFYRWVCDVCNTGPVAKFIVTALIWLVVSVPFDLYLLVRWGMDPNGFWQELAMLIVWGIVLGWLQGILVFFGIILTIAVLLEDL